MFKSSAFRNSVILWKHSFVVFCGMICLMGWFITIAWKIGVEIMTWISLGLTSFRSLYLSSCELILCPQTSLEGVKDSNRKSSSWLRKCCSIRNKGGGKKKFIKIFQAMKLTLESSWTLQATFSAHYVWKYICNEHEQTGYLLPCGIWLTLLMGLSFDLIMYMGSMMHADRHLTATYWWQAALLLKQDKQANTIMTNYHWTILKYK